MLLGASGAYYILVRLLLHSHSHDSLLARAMGNDLKGRVSVWIYIAAIAVAFRWPWLAGICYGTVSIIWLLPDRRVEKALAANVR